MNNVVTLIALASIGGMIVFWTRDKAMLYAILSASLVLLFGLTVVDDFTPEWKGYQKEYAKLLVEKETNPEAKAKLANFPIKIRQQWNQDLDIADRCVSCHLGVDNPDMANAPQPFTFHPWAHQLKDGRIVHDFNSIGCTTCHMGQGRATDAESAHARHIGFWDEPMYPTGEHSLVQASCPQCHLELSKPEGYEILDGAEDIMDARDFADGQNEMEFACIECHTIYGQGEVLAPDLTSYGESTEHEFELTHSMDHLEGGHNKLNWTYEHFLDPKKITPGDPKTGQEETIMPNFEMDKKQAMKMVAWVYSMKESKIPSKYLYKKGVKIKKQTLAEQMAGLYTAEEFANLEDGEKLFLRYNCWICHTIRGKGGKLGPDLSKVGTRRKPDWMIKHFKDPRSLKQKSFMPQFNLTAEQMDKLVVYLQSLK